MRATRRSTARDLSQKADVGWPRPVAVPASLPRCGSQDERSCSICSKPALDDLVDAAGDVGVVHRPCFVRWDTAQEALEQMIARSFGFPHHAEAAADLELEPLRHEVAAIVASPSSPPSRLSETVDAVAA
jgi:hypothetical protein